MKKVPFRFFLSLTPRKLVGCASFITLLNAFQTFLEQVQQAYHG